MSLKEIFISTSMWYLVLILFVNTVADISVYYFGSNEPPRTSKALSYGNCRTEETANYCYEKCGSKHTCLLGQCFCVNEYITSGDSNLVIKTEEFRVRHKVLPSKSSEEEDEEESTNLEPNNLGQGLEEHPALRHHIAHFCPDLDLARDCIYQCMAVGKPAFCGKDHVCYCGHLYENPATNPGMNPNESYNQFRDLYEKYFGPEYPHIPKLLKKKNPKEKRTKKRKASKGKATIAEETKASATKAEKMKADGTKEEETKANATKADGTKEEDTKANATKADGTKEEETKADGTKEEETKAEETKAEETKADETATN
nr:uncharacterized protein LOC110373304 [Helicoverpa armigera]